MKKYYECKFCDYKSTRKANASRHIRLVHKEPAHTLDFKPGTHTETKLDNVKSLRSDLLIDDDLRVSNVLCKMQRPMEDFEKLCSEMPKEVRYQYLSHILKLSFLSNNPVRNIELQLRENMSQLLLTKFALYFSSDKSLSTFQAEEYIKRSIISCYSSMRSTEDHRIINKSRENLRAVQSLLAEASMTCLSNRVRAKEIVDKVLLIEPTNAIALIIKNYCDSNP